MKAKAPNEHEDGLLEYLEDIIGTAKYKEPIEEALVEADRLAEERSEKMARLKIVEKEKGKLEAEKREAEAFLKDQNELVRAQSKLWQYNMYRCKQNVEATKEHIANLKAELEAETTANAEHIRAAEELQAQYAEKREAFDELESSLAAITKSLSAQSKIEVGLEEKRKHVKAKQKKLQKGIEDDTHAKHEAETWIVNHTEQIEKSTAELAKLEKELVAEEKELEVIANSLKGKTQVFHDKIQAKQAELAPWQQKIEEQAGSLGVTTRERDLLVSKGKSASQAVEDAAASLQELKDAHEVKQTEVETAKGDRAKLRKELQDAEKTLRDMGTRVEQLKGTANASRHKRDEAKASNAQNTSQNAVLDTLMKLKSAGRLEGFHGRLGSLGTIPDKYDVAVTTAAGALNNMVVDTVEQAQACIDHLRKYNAGRANFYTKCEKDSKKYIQSIEANEIALEQTETEMATLDADLQTCQTDMRKLQKAVSQAEAAKDTYEDTLKELKEELDDKMKLTQSFRAKEQEFKQQISESEKELKGHKHKLKEYAQLHNRLELHDVDDDEDEEKPEAPAGETETNSPVDGQENADGQAGDAEPKVKADPDGEASKSSAKRDPLELQIYSDEELEEMNRERLVHNVTILEDKVGNAKPNLNVLVEYRRREKEYLQRAKEFDRVTKQRDEQKAKYEELRKRRLDEFMTGFNTISSKLKEMYQMITLGGNAELDLVDSMDPFSEGVNFSVMPPKKSWKNISNLSGGEKTLSSLALVFALHVFKPTPLYFMDEIDAALDFRNVSIVANYIKDRTKDAHCALRDQRVPIKFAEVRADLLRFKNEGGKEPGGQDAETPQVNGESVVAAGREK
ncbi:hypothetical protein FRC06_001412 [Ceratobasidium sp. 370]|nr:hypothetical protein FRC06_001412 [Ceratobasidium sp. 370]